MNCIVYHYYLVFRPIVQEHGEINSKEYFKHLHIGSDAKSRDDGHRVLIDILPNTNMARINR